VGLNKTAASGEAPIGWSGVITDNGLIRRS
jgi:hypothetical protein